MYDAETGLYYLRARYYDPSMGWFLNEDTYEGQIDNPLSRYIREVSDGLAGELYTEDGWISRYSSK